MKILTTKARARAGEARPFTCKGCKRVTSPHHGCDDDMPNHCDDCWLVAHPEHQRAVTT